MSTSSAPSTDAPSEEMSPWPALWALIIGIFMILVDSTIVSVAMPVIMEDLHTDYSTVIWATSAYLLAYAVPLLVTGRLGDRFGPKNIYLLGLTVFTVASLWCGLTGSIEMLIVARIVQGLGAALLTPQTMAVITRTFPPAKRGSAMALWGAAGGIATLVGPILGGVLVDALGWEWIFFINVPVGIIGLILAVRLVPALPTHTHSFDWLGVALSGIGVFLVVFGIQEGEKYDWGQIDGIISVPLLIILGLVAFAAFVYWQSRITKEPLVPLGLFRDRNFSLGNTGVALVSLAITSISLPFFFYAQGVRGWSSTQSALLVAPMAVLLLVLSPFVGKLVDKTHPRNITLVGFGAAAVALIWLSQLISPDTHVWALCLPLVLLGIANACLWSPLGATTTRNLPMASAGSGAGVYNATRQIAAVLGSAAVAALIQARLSANGLHGDSQKLPASGVRMPENIEEPFSHAMSQTLYLPAIAFLIGMVVVLFLANPSHAGHGGPPTPAAAEDSAPPLQASGTNPPEVPR